MGRQPRDTLRWGILGPGAIAHAFAEGIRALDDAVLHAVGSRSAARAQAFASRYGAERVYGSYEELVADPDVDVVYVATPHFLHREHTLLALDHGKAVLCEKPLATSLADAEAMVTSARQRKVFLMEAMWTRCLPHVERALEIVAEGGIGEPRLVAADFGFRAEVNVAQPLFDPTRGGGSLLDVGVYPLWFAHWVFGEPSDVASFMHIGSTGVDEEAAMLLRYPTGATALLSSAIRLETPHDATIAGTAGILRLLPSWWGPSRLTLRRGEGAATDVPVRAVGNGYDAEAAEVGRCLRAGLLESERVPLASSLAVMRTRERVRAAATGSNARSD